MADKKAEVQEEPKPAEEQDSSTLPTIAEEKTEPSAEAFAKMRQEIKELRGQLENREQLTSSFTSRYQQPPIQQIGWGSQPVETQAFIDPVTGEFKANEYSQAVSNAIARSQQTTQNFTENLVKEEVDWGVARMKFPELDNNQDFAEDVWGQYLIERQKNPMVSPIDVVQKVKTKWDRLEKRETTKVEAEAKEATSQKEIATAEASAAAPAIGQRQQVAEAEEDDELLKARSRGLIGDIYSGKRLSKEEQNQAIVERLKKKAWHKPLEEAA